MPAAVPAVVRTRWTGPPGVVGGRTLLEWPGCDHGGGRAELSSVGVSTWQASSVFRRSTRAFRVRRENFRGGDDAVRSGATFLRAVVPVDRLLLASRCWSPRMGPTTHQIPEGTATGSAKRAQETGQPDPITPRGLCEASTRGRDGQAASPPRVAAMSSGFPREAAVVLENGLRTRAEDGDLARPTQ